MSTYEEMSRMSLDEILEFNAAIDMEFEARKKAQENN